MSESNYWYRGDQIVDEPVFSQKEILLNKAIYYISGPLKYHAKAFSSASCRTLEVLLL